MKDLKLFLILFMSLYCADVFAGGIGYIDYQKVLDNYLFAKSTITEIQNKHSEIQKYLELKEIEFSKLETPLQKQKFESTVQNELRTKENAFNDFRNKKEEAVYSRIHAVSEKIRLEKGFDAILDARSVFSGGVDITD
jgi:Skp family chaperone for outer membrane proteins